MLNPEENVLGGLIVADLLLTTNSLLLLPEGLRGVPRPDGMYNPSSQSWIHLGTPPRLHSHQNLVVWVVRHLIGSHLCRLDVGLKKNLTGSCSVEQTEANRKLNPAQLWTPAAAKSGQQEAAQQLKEGETLPFSPQRRFSRCPKSILTRTF